MTSNQPRPTTSPAGDDPRKSYEWRKIRTARITQGKANQERCYRCGQPVDYSLPGSHPRGATVDHTQPLIMGGTLADDLAISHASCNSSHGATLGNHLRALIVAGTAQGGPPPPQPASEYPSTIRNRQRPVFGLRPSTAGNGSDRDALNAAWSQLTGRSPCLDECQHMGCDEPGTLYAEPAGRWCRTHRPKLWRDPSGSGWAIPRCARCGAPGRYPMPRFGSDPVCRAHAPARLRRFLDQRTEIQ